MLPRDSQFPRIFQHAPGTYPRPESPTVYEGILFIWGFGDAWGMLQGYVGVLIDSWYLDGFNCMLILLPWFLRHSLFFN